MASWNKLVNFEEMQMAVHHTAKEHGWWEDKDYSCIPEKLALVHSEISEALEEYRNDHVLYTYYDEDSGKPEGFVIELADAVIRIMDLAEWLGLDLAGSIIEKHEYNVSRPFKHGGKKA